MTERLINGVPESQYGSWCRHGKRIMVADPVAADPNYPGLVFVVPWPCDAPDCSREEVERQIEQEADDWDRERWAEYYDDIRASVSFDMAWNRLYSEDGY